MCCFVFCFHYSILINVTERLLFLSIWIEIFYVSVKGFLQWEATRSICIGFSSRLHLEVASKGYGFMGTINHTIWRFFFPLKIEIFLFFLFTVGD